LIFIIKLNKVSQKKTRSEENFSKNPSCFAKRASKKTQ